MSEWDVELQIGPMTWMRARLDEGGLYVVQIDKPGEGDERDISGAALNRSQLAILTDSMQRAAGVMM